MTFDLWCVVERVTQGVKGTEKNASPKQVCEQKSEGLKNLSHLVTVTDPSLSSRMMT